VLLELEDEVVERYMGTDSESELRQETRQFINCALANVADLFDAAIRLSAPRTAAIRQLAQTLHDLLPTRGSGKRPLVDQIAALLECIAIKSGGRRQAQWTLDFIAVKAGWAADTGDGTGRISPADRQHISRFMRRICQDYYRDPSGNVRDDVSPPLLPLIRCDRKGWQGVPSLYTFLWENWGDAFVDLCDNECLPPRSNSVSNEELMDMECLIRRRRDNQ
jgi:hypothetical protein